MKKHTLCALALLTALSASSSRANIVITATFDSSIANDANAVAIENTINSALQAYQQTFLNNIVVPVYFQKGSSLGESNYLVYQRSYSAFYNSLAATDANPAAIQALQTNGGAGTINPASGGSGIEIKSANARAVGMNIAPGCFVNSVSNQDVPNVCGLSGSGPAYDAIVSVQTGITSPPNGPNYFDLLSTVEHELNEVLGLGSALENCDPNSTSISACSSNGVVNASNDSPFGYGTPEDLFRWNAASGGARTLSVDCAAQAAAFFSYGPSTGAIAQFHNSCDGADFGDWEANDPQLGSSPGPRVQDAFSTTGSAPALGTAELDALSAIGYEVSAPEPATWTLAIAAAAVIAARRFTACR